MSHNIYYIEWITTTRAKQQISVLKTWCLHRNLLHSVWQLDYCTQEIIWQHPSNEIHRPYLGLCTFGYSIKEVFCAEHNKMKKYHRLDLERVLLNCFLAPEAMQVGQGLLKHAIPWFVGVGGWYAVLSVTPLMGHLGCLASHWSVPVDLQKNFCLLSEDQWSYFGQTGM